MIRRLELAMKNYSVEDQHWLRKIMDPDDPCVLTLVRLVVEPKYKEFVNLRCVVLRALQITIRLAKMMVVGPLKECPDVGMRCLQHLVGLDLAIKATEVIAGMVRCEATEPVAACNALLMLAELGPEALAPDVAPRRLLDLFVMLPDRAAELVEVALRLHSLGDPQRDALLTAAVSHAGGSLLCEVLLQVINRADVKRRLRSLKVLTGFLLRPGSESLLYTNDVRVLVEILIRELPTHAEEVKEFEACADCFKALANRCAVARTHRRSEILQVFEDLHADEQASLEVREKCYEVLQMMGQAGP